MLEFVFAFVGFWVFACILWLLWTGLAVFTNATTASVLVLFSGLLVALAVL